MMRMVGQSLRSALAAGIALVPGAATLYLGLSAGGYFAAPTGVLTALLLGLLALIAALPGSPWRGWGRAVAAAAVPLAALALWAYLSGSWGGSTSRAAVEANRVVLYLAMLLLMASAGWSSARMRLMVGGLASAIVAIAVAALATRLLGTAAGLDGTSPDQLSYPVTYWNALGLLTGFGIVLCLHLASSLQEPIWVRASAAAGLPVLSSALLLTLSRGALWCTALGIVVYVVVARPRGLLGASVAVLPFTFVALLGLDHGAVVGTAHEQIEASGLGSQPAWIIGFCSIAAAVARVVAVPLDRRLARISVDARLSRVLAVSGALALVIVAVTAGLVVQRTGVGSRAYEAFASPTEAVGGGSSRLTSLSNNNRVSKWRIALDEWRSHPLKGTGAGTFGLSWQRERATEGHVREAHSLYAEFLGELGSPGLFPPRGCDRRGSRWLGGPQPRTRQGGLGRAARRGSRMGSPRRCGLGLGDASRDALAVRGGGLGPRTEI